MTLEDGFIDECGTGRHTPPPTYQELRLQNAVAYTDFVLDPRNSDGSDLSNPNTYLFQITKNTKMSAESSVKICQMLEVRDGVTNTIRAIYRLLEVQDGLTNTCLPVFSFILISQLILLFTNLLLMPYSSISKLSELEAVENLNLTENEMQIILSFSKKHVLHDLRNCISQYL